MSFDIFMSKIAISDDFIKKRLQSVRSQATTSQGDISPQFRARMVRFFGPKGAAGRLHAKASTLLDKAEASGRYGPKQKAMRDESSRLFARHSMMEKALTSPAAPSWMRG